jgi:lipopolysaccharide biosynthesis glycosyltransferase
MKVNLAFCHQGTGIVGLAVSIVSALVSCHSSEVHVHVHSDCDPGLISHLASFFRKYSREVKISLYQLDFSVLEKYKLDYPLIYYYRLLLPQLHNDLSELIYLDTDLIIERDLSQLPEMVRAKCQIAGVRDPIESMKCKVLNTNPPYINSGLMYLNLNALRQFNFTESCLRWLNNHCGKGLTLHDQDAINVYLNGQSLALLDKSWNEILPDPRLMDNFTDRVIHITGPFKPWTLCCPIPYKTKFLRYLELCGLSEQYEPVQPVNQSQSVFVANQFRIVSDFEKSLFWFHNALRFRWLNKDSDFTHFLTEVQRMESYRAQGKLRIASQIAANAFESVGFAKDCLSPYEYPSILE